MRLAIDKTPRCCFSIKHQPKQTKLHEDVKIVLKGTDKSLIPIEVEITNKIKQKFEKTLLISGISAQRHFAHPWTQTTSLPPISQNRPSRPSHPQPPSTARPPQQQLPSPRPSTPAPLTWATALGSASSFCPANPALAAWGTSQGWGGASCSRGDVL